MAVIALVDSIVDGFIARTFLAAVSKLVSRPIGFRREC